MEMTIAAAPATVRMGASTVLTWASSDTATAETTLRVVVSP
jgi:hypothetical protein